MSRAFGPRAGKQNPAVISIQQILCRYIINKSGGLIYSKVGRDRLGWHNEVRGKDALGKIFTFSCIECVQDFTELARVDLNDSLRLASIW